MLSQNNSQPTESVQDYSHGNGDYSGNGYDDLMNSPEVEARRQAILQIGKRRILRMALLFALLIVVVAYALGYGLMHWFSDGTTSCNPIFWSLNAQIFVLILLTYLYVIFAKILVYIYRRFPYSVEQVLIEEFTQRPGTVVLKIVDKP